MKIIFFLLLLLIFEIAVHVFGMPRWETLGLEILSFILGIIFTALIEEDK